LLFKNLNRFINWFDKIYIYKFGGND